MKYILACQDRKRKIQSFASKRFSIFNIAENVLVVTNLDESMKVLGMYVTKTY